MAASPKGGTVTMDGTAKSLTDWIATITGIVANIDMNILVLQALGGNADPIHVGFNADIASDDTQRAHSINPGGSLSVEITTALRPTKVFMYGTTGDKARIIEIGY